MAGPSVWERFALDPRDERHARLRAADRDRDIVNDVLGTAYADGQLTPDELDERSDAVARSKTLGELPPLLDDLVDPAGPHTAPQVLESGSTRAVGPHRAEAERRYRRVRLLTLLVFLVPTLICWVVWTSLALADRGEPFPWPIFPTLGTSIPLLVVLVAHRDLVAGAEHRLERRKARRRRNELPPPDPAPRQPPSPPAAPG